MVPIEREHQELGAQQPRQRAVDHQVDHQFAVDPGSPGQSCGHPQARQKCQRDQYTVGGQEEIAELEQLGEHSDPKITSQDATAEDEACYAAAYCLSTSEWPAFTAATQWMSCLRAFPSRAKANTNQDVVI